MLTAKKIYDEIVRMPVKEREKLFSVIARKGFEKDFYAHSEVFADVRSAPFTVAEAAEYLEVAEITLRRWVKDGAIRFGRIGRNIVFDADRLKEFKAKRIAK